MKKRLVKALLLIFIINLLLGLSGCMTVAEKEALVEFETEAAAYFKNKYGNAPRIESCNYYISNDGIFPVRTQSMYARCHDGTYIFYDAKRDQIVDNRQSEELSAAIEKELKRQMKAVTDIIPGSELIIRNYCSTAYAGEYEGNFYHSYYDGNIEKFLAEEDVQLVANMYLLCKGNDPWQEAQKQCEEILKKDFRTEHTISLTVATRECYETNQSEEYIYVGIDDIGCFASYHMMGIEQETRAYIQNYIKIAPGLYATANEANFVFEDNDIVAIEGILEDVLNAKMLDAFNDLKDKTGSMYSEIAASTPIYNFVFSERVKKQFPNGKATVYLMMKPEEISASDSDQLLYYQNESGQYRVGAYAPVNGGNAAWATINENDYYLIGTSYLLDENGDVVNS